MPGSGPKFGEFTWWRKGGGSGCVVVLIGLGGGAIAVSYTTARVLAIVLGG